jgi:heme o synthase
LALFGILFFWQLPHFLAIALYRKEEYRRAGIQVLPVAKGDATTKRRIPLYTAALVVCSLTLQPLGIAGTLYTVVASLLGAAFLAGSLLGLSPRAGDVWARNLFLGSLVYLTLLFVALACSAR